ncbi:hypothetical protein [Staphylococcus capitis]
MKFKLLGTAILSSALVLTACGQDGDKSNKDDNKKSESKSAKKSNDPKKNKDKKSEDNKKKDSNKDKGQPSEDTQQNEQSNEQQTQQNNTQNNSNQISQQQNNQQAQQSNSKEPTKEEIAEWDRQNVKGGTDYGLIDPKEANESSQSQNEEPDEWVKGQEEWANANQSQKEEIRKQDAEKYGYEYDPKNYEE